MRGPLTGAYILLGAFIAGAIVSFMLLVGWLPEWLAPVKGSW